MLVRKFVLCAFATSLLCAVPISSAEVAGKSGGLLNLTGDRKALKIGDLLHVQVLESSSATASADTSTGKSGGVGIGVRLPNTVKGASIDMDSDFSGRGKVVRSGKVLAQLSVIVTGMDDTGLLNVAGQQVIEVNGEKQEIELSGRVRPEDVTDGNTIVSSRIADARIRYVGDGVLAEQQKPGVLTRLFSWLGLL